MSTNDSGSGSGTNDEANITGSNHRALESECVL